MVQALTAVFRWLASLKLAVVLILVLAAVLAWATLLESSRGGEYAQWYVYKSSWFVALLALLGVNILASALIRFPWARSGLGFVVTHAGLLVLLFGAIQTFRHGVEGQLIFAEGQGADSFQMPDKCQLKLTWQTQPNRLTQDFTFRPGPVDWPPGKALDFGELDGVQLKVLRFLRHAKNKGNWVADELGEGGPAALVEVSVGKTRQRVWLQQCDENDGFQLLQTAQGPLAIRLGCERLPLGFALKLVKFHHGKNPGQMGDASFASTVQLIDRAKRIDQPRTISMNEPLVYGKYTLYQSSFQETAEGAQTSSLTVACDPGRWFKYVGSLMICGGGLVMFIAQAIGWKTFPFPPSGRKSQTGAPVVNSSRKHLRRSGKNGAKPSLAGSRQDP